MKRLKNYVEMAGIDQWGVCSFREASLLPVRSRSRIPPEASHIIVFVFGYYTEEYPERNISRYAIADDYHTVLLPRLRDLAETLEAAFSGERFIPFIDASPVEEVRAAYLAGLGDIGKNGLLLNPCYGSYCFIGELVTTMPMVLAQSKPQRVCTGCGACIAACPSGALTEQGFLKEKCRSHITQKKGELADWEKKEIAAGGMAWGCDCCVDACPVNRRAQKSRVPEFYQNRIPIVTESSAETLCKIKSFGWRGQSVLLRNLSYLAKIENEPLVR